jgi:hypothetical protein
LFYYPRTFSSRLHRVLTGWRWVSSLPPFLLFLLISFPRDILRHSLHHLSSSLSYLIAITVLHSPPRYRT